MVENFWKNREQNGNKCTYWNNIDGEKLNSSEKQVCRFMEKIEDRYMHIYLYPRDKLFFNSMRPNLPHCRENVLESYAQCAVMTNLFVPIQEMLFSWNELSYEQANALWRGTGYKGHYAYAQDFICKELNKTAPSTDKLFNVHQMLETKGLKLSAVYAKHLDWTKHESQNVNVWDSLNSSSAKFRAQVIKAYPSLENKIMSLRPPVQVACHTRHVLKNTRQEELQKS